MAAKNDNKQTAKEKELDKNIADETKDAKEACEETKEECKAADAEEDCCENIEDSETTASEAEDSKEASKGGAFSKFKKEKKDKKDEQIAELNDRLIRNMAEFENFRKRTDREKSEMFENGARSVVEKLLPVVDNFERGLASIPDEDKETPVAKGMDMIYKQILKVFEDMGVTAIEAVGKEFNPDFHNAVMHGEDEELGENIVSEEFQKGYMYHEKVVRHSMVKVVN